MPLQACKSNEPIPGYTITHRIGAGGYGEVWQAEAPGGIAKAIKFVYGYLSEERAANELKALNRIKEVRHPFLLSLERIEVVEGQLVIVTELADASLKDRFEELRAEGKPGIPRDELLVYLSDAADALDYMSAHHRLQHLDVKPENLLLVGGRVKVADFGLVKDVVATAVSVMGGMTPVYAAPEVFDGRPTGYSDQYSLAIVYQELLTGILPFSGKTPSQLAKQHTASVPRLSPLPDIDRSTIARALAKDPHQRFGSCREMVDSLRTGGAGRGRSSLSEENGDHDTETNVDTTSVAGRETQRVDEPDRTGESLERRCQTSSFEAPESDGRQDPQTIGRSSTLAPPGTTGSRSAPATDLPPPAMNDAPAGLEPMLVIGIGGTASRVMGHLRRKWHDRLADADALVNRRMLLIDSDAAELCRAASVDDAAVRLQADETLGTPLRKPQDYRSRSDKFLKWLSRRWLYNIPRSLKTEGMRPLGRLALVDHADEIYGKLRSAIQRTMESRDRAASGPGDNAPDGQRALRVVVVSSISGGTGSGMVLDVAYMLRKVLEELHVAQSHVCGILLHATPRAASARNLAEGNAFACLSELYNFSHADGSYPGDPASALPPLEGRMGTFDDTYVVSLGRELTDAQYDRATAGVAEYLYLDSATAASRFFAACRGAEKQRHAKTHSEPRVRTFGVSEMGFMQADLLSHIVNRLSHDVLLRWLGECDTEEDEKEQARIEPSAVVNDPRERGPSPLETEMERRAAQLVEKLEVDYERLCEELDGIVQQRLGRGVEPYFAEMLKAVEIHVREKADGDGTSLTRAIQAIRRIVGFSVDDDGAELMETSVSVSESLDMVLREHVRQRAPLISHATRQWLDDIVNEIGHRVAASAFAATWLARFVQAQEHRATQELRDTEALLTGLTRTIMDARSRRESREACLAFDRRGRPKNDVTRQLLQYACSSVRAAMLHAIRQMAQALQTTFDEASKRLRDMEREIRQQSEVLATACEPEAEASVEDGADSEDGHASIEHALGRRLPELACLLDERVQVSYLDSAGGLSNVLSGNVVQRAMLPERLRESARLVVLESLKGIDLVAPLLHSAGGEESPFRGFVDSAQPHLRECGGGRRLLLVGPDAGNHESLSQAVQEITGCAAAVVHDVDPNLALCCEMEQMPLSLVSGRLIEHQPDVVDLASRLHTRVDVEWALPCRIP